MISRRTAAFLGIFVVLAAHSLSAGDHGIYISEVGFATGMDGRNPLNLVAPLGEIRGKSLFFWVKLSGDQAAYDELKAKGLLPLSHEWVKLGPLHRDINQQTTSQEDPEKREAEKMLVQTGNSPEGTAEEMAVEKRQPPIPVGSIKGYEALKYELDTRGSFDWRVWSNLQKTLGRSSYFIVRVLDAKKKRLTTMEGQDEFLITYVR